MTAPIFFVKFHLKLQKKWGIRFHIILFGTRRILSSAIKYQRERIAYIQSHMLISWHNTSDNI